MMATLLNTILHQIFGLILHGPAFGLSENGHRASVDFLEAWSPAWEVDSGGNLECDGAV